MAKGWDGQHPLSHTLPTARAAAPNLSSSPPAKAACASSRRMSCQSGMCDHTHGGLPPFWFRFPTNAAGTIRTSCECAHFRARVARRWPIRMVGIVGHLQPMVLVPGPAGSRAVSPLSANGVSGGCWQAPGQGTPPSQRHRPHEAGCGKATCECGFSSPAPPALHPSRSAASGHLVRLVALPTDADVAFRMEHLFNDGA